MTAIELVDEQLKHYNARDVEKFVSVYSNDIVCYSLKDNRVLFQGMKAFKENYAGLFAVSPHLRATVTQRMALGDFVVDYEQASGNRNQDVTAIAIYKITNGKISHVWFAL